MLLLVAVCLLLTAPHAQAISPDYTEELLKRSAELHLDSSREWHALIHIASVSSVKSEVDDPAFFLSPQGHNDAREELASTIKALATDAASDNAAQCKFPARYSWLKAALHFDSSKIPEFPCPEFKKWNDAINPHGLTLIFPTSFLNNPTSAFGHTLLRIDSPNRADDESLPDYTANYAAETLGENAILYALKGTLGGYNGYFSVAPYYEKVKKYSDLENRDIWEYELALTPTEVTHIVEHLWELKRIGLEYYYFDENCAYELLSLLKVARPSLDLYSDLLPWIIPVDTVRAVVKVPGLIKNRRYRPSAASILMQRMKDASGVQIRDSKALADRTLEVEKLTTENAEIRARTLDLAYDFLTYRKIKERSDDPTLKDLGYELLRARSQTGIRANPIQVPSPIAPEDGHRTLKTALRTGTYGDRAFYEVGVRPAYHDLLDPGGGYTPGAQIKFFDLALRQEEGRSFTLQEFTALDILSITPQNEFFEPWSWQIHFALAREDWSSSEQPLVGENLVKFGRTFEPSRGIHLFALVGPEVRIGQSFDEAYALGFGPKVGVVTNPLNNLAASLIGSWDHFDLGDEFASYRFGGEARYTLNQNLALRAGITREQDYKSPSTEFILSLEWFP